MQASRHSRQMSDSSRAEHLRSRIVNRRALSGLCNDPCNALRHRQHTRPGPRCCCVHSLPLSFDSTSTRNKTTAKTPCLVRCRRSPVSVSLSDFFQAPSADYCEPMLDTSRRRP